MLARCAVSREMTVSSDPVSRMKSCVPAAVHLAPARRSCRPRAGTASCAASVEVLLIDVDRLRVPRTPSRNFTCDRVHDALSLRSLFGSRLMKLCVGVGGLVEPVQPLVDVADLGVDLAVARRHAPAPPAPRSAPRRASCASPATAPMPNRARDDSVLIDSACAIHVVRFIEQADRPERVRVERQRL